MFPIGPASDPSPLMARARGRRGEIKSLLLRVNEMAAKMPNNILSRFLGRSSSSESYGAKLRRELEDDYRVFYVTAWGYAADHYFGWFPKALNLHPEIFALLAHEGSRPKYLKERTRSERPALIPFTEFLNDMGMTYQAIGDCYSYRAGQMPELLSDPRYKGIPVVNLVRHPFVWLEFYVRWRAGNMRMRAGSADPLAWEWKVAHHGTFHHLGLKPYSKDDVQVWAAFQGMVQLNNVLGDLPAVEKHIPIERVATDPPTFTDIVAYLTKGRCTYDANDLERVFAMTDTLFRGEEKVQTDFRTLAESWPGWKVDAFRTLLRPEALSAYKSFGYDLCGLDAPIIRPLANLIEGPSRPIFVSSVMKSGTWLLRNILEQLTGLRYHEPKILPGTPAYDNEMLIDIPPGTFFSWHSILNERSTALLRGAATKNIFLVRNIYAVLISMYNHLVGDVDSSIGRSVGGSDYLRTIAPEFAISMMIAGFTNSSLTWDGLAPHVRQIASLLRFKEEVGDALLLSYEELTGDKENAVHKIAQYLELTVSDDIIEKISATTSFQAMKTTASQTGADRHFTSDRDRDIIKFLKPAHVAMIDRVVMSEFPNVAARLALAGVPSLFQPPDAVLEK